jgi:flagellar protein FliO/FliZ
VIRSPKARASVWLGVAVLGLLLVAVTALAAGDTVGGIPGMSLVRLAVGTIIAVAVLLLGARWFVRYSGAQGGAVGALRVVASLPVGQRERAVVIQVGERQLLLGVAPGRVALLHELDPVPPAVERRNETQAAAPVWLARVLGKNA